MNSRMKDRVVIVTGSSRGIGRGVALNLAREGAKIVVNYVSRKEKADEVVEEIESFGGQAIPPVRDGS